MHEMLKKERKMTNEESIAILKTAEYGVLCTIGEDGYPYGVPISFVYYNDVIYFHCKKDKGHKIENIKYNNKVSFTVITNTKVLPEEFSTKYESVIVFGEVFETKDKINNIMRLVEKYSSNFVEKGKEYAKAAENEYSLYEIHIKKISAKGRK